MSSSQGKGEMNRLWVEQKLWNWRGARKQEQVDTQLRLSRVLLPGGASPALSCPGFHTARCELLVAPEPGQVDSETRAIHHGEGNPFPMGNPSSVTKEAPPTDAHHT